MRIAMGDGRVFQGTALQIVGAMRDVAFAPGDVSLAEYVAWPVRHARSHEEVDLDVTGETDDALAASLVAELLRAGLARKL